MDFNSIADDFFVNMDLQTALELPMSRDTVLHFCESVQKRFPEMTNFYQRDTGEFVLEADRESGSYQWLELQSRRLSAGYFNPPDTESAYSLHSWLLEGSTYFLGVRGLDVEALDVLFGFNMDFKGNRDAIVAEAILGGSAIGTLVSELSDRTVECEPSVVISVNDDCSMQARLSLESRGDSLQVRTGEYEDEPISVYFTVRKYPKPGEVIQMKESFARQCEICEEMVCRSVIPNIVHPIATAIATAQ